MNQELIGWQLLFSGIIFVVSFVFLALMFSVKTSPWGTLNDITYVLALLLIIPYLISFYAKTQAISPVFSFLAAAAGVAGILIITITQFGLVFGKIKFELNLRQGAFGSGLLGIAFIINSLISSYMGISSGGLNWLGLACGIMMSMGIPTGLFFGKEENDLVTGKLQWKHTNRVAMFSILTTFLGQIALIVWVFSTAFTLIS